ncbi:MAG: hypothetical protein ACOYK8_03030 [Alphaproteobacteria bacterium]
MRNHSKKTLMATAAVLSMVLVSGQAMAFDNVSWDWNSTVTQSIAEDINITVDANPSGIVNIEKLQLQIGDVTANSNVSGFQNNAFSDGTTTSGPFVVSMNDNFTISTITNDTTDPSTINPSAPVFGSNHQLQSEILNGTLDKGSNILTINYHVFGDVTVDPENVSFGSLDAIDLPSVVSAATAVGNNQSINSSVALNLHDGQFLFGGFATDTSQANIDALNSALNGASSTGNTHTDIAEILTLSAALGIITPASITATSTVDDILNASVDSTATAVGNNFSVNLTPLAVGDSTVIADITQFGYANVSASSTVTNVDVDNYTNFSAAGFGALSDTQKPLVNSVATAVGNNLAITVSAPVPAL